MIFKPEMVEKILAGQKTVTRRPVKFETVDHGVTLERPCRYVPGQHYALQPVIEDGAGKGRGGKEVARIRVLSVERVHVGTIDDADAEREGFQDRNEFRAYWHMLYGSWDALQLVDRIEFELLPDSPVKEGAR